MEIEKLNKWLSLAANIGVIAGIVFLAIEIRQNDATLEESNRINVLDARAFELQQYNDFRLTLVQSPELMELWTAGLDGDDLSETDEDRFLSLCTNYLWLSVTAYERSEELGRIETASETARIRGELLRDSPGFQRCWKENREMVLGYGQSSYVFAVEAIANQ